MPPECQRGTVVHECKSAVVTSYIAKQLRLMKRQLRGKRRGREVQHPVHRSHYARISTKGKARKAPRSSIRKLSYMTVERSRRAGALGNNGGGTEYCRHTQAQAQAR